MNWDLTIRFNSQTASGVLATLPVKDGVVEFKHARKLAVKNEGSVDLVLTVDYLDTDGNWQNVTGLAGVTIVAQAEIVYELYAPEGTQVRFTGAGLTNGFFVISEVVPTSCIGYTVPSTLSFPGVI